MSIGTEFGLTLQVAGDGTSTIVDVPLELPPINMKLAGNTPVVVFSVSPGVAAELTHGGTRVKLTFDAAPPDFVSTGSVVPVVLALKFPAA